MYYYHILVEKWMPFDLLTYSSEHTLGVGAVVRVGVRNTEVYGIVVQLCADISNLSVEKIKPITSVLPVIFAPAALSFLSLFAYNTFNNRHAVCEALCTPLKNLMAIDWNRITEHAEIEEIRNTQVDNTKPKTALFYREKDYLVRIKYIIRSLLSSSGSAPILIVCPEKTIARSIATALRKEYQGVLSVHQYQGDKSKMSRSATTALLTLSVGALPLVVVGTRSAVFLPYSVLPQVIMVDEASPFYIQEQNGLYFDTRDALFYLSEVFAAQLSFVSTLPSVRLHRFYSESILQESVSTTPSSTQKPLKIKLYEQNRQDMFFALFSHEILTDIGVEYAHEQP
jgi:primosomal protein N'